ncbi:MAG: hypothetical protein LBQ69_03520 [Treponema sp.]|jgi:hypothetical protein|nr:hypothetical protein [Treponema sp.]
MELVNGFIAEKTGFKTMGYREQPTASGRATQLSVYLAEKDYDPKDDNYACFNAPEHKLPPSFLSHSSSEKDRSHRTHLPINGFSGSLRLFSYGML